MNYKLPTAQKLIANCRYPKTQRKVTSYVFLQIGSKQRQVAVFPIILFRFYKSLRHYELYSQSLQIADQHTFNLQPQSKKHPTTVFALSGIIILIWGFVLVIRCHWSKLDPPWPQWAGAGWRCFSCWILLRSLRISHSWLNKQSPEAIRQKCALTTRINF